MDSEERTWHLKRIYDQKKKESDAVKKAQGGTNKPASGRMRRRRRR